MSLVMRLRQQGRKNKKMYRLVVADKRYPRDGKYIDCLGHYNPHDANTPVVFNLEKIDSWLSQGVQPTEKVQALLKQARASGAKETKK